MENEVSEGECFSEIMESMSYEQDEREKEWRKGYHTTRDYEKINLCDMKTSHLRNTIRLFWDYDTSPLKIELNKR